MPTEPTAEYWRRTGRIEGIVLLLGAPFLLFPERFLFATIAVLLLFATVWLAPVLFIRSPLLPSTPYNLALLILWLMILIGTLVSADPMLTLPKVTGLVLGFSVWRYLNLSVRDRYQLGWATAGYIGAGVAFVVIGFASANWLLKGAAQVTFLQGFVPGSPLLNLGGEGIHPNQIAGTITLVLPLLVALVASAPTGKMRNGRAIRIALIALTTVITVALLLTQSRSGWLGTLGGCVLLMVLWSLLMGPSPARRWLRLGLIACGVLGIAALILVGPQTLSQFWLEPPVQSAVGSLKTLDFRRELWPWALAAVSDFPFTGPGLGTFREVALRLYPVSIPPGFDFAHAHNVFLQVALDVGLPGLVAYNALVLVSFAISWQIARRDEQLCALALGLMASLAAFHLYGLADTIALGAKPAILWWGILGLLSVMTRLVK